MTAVPGGAELGDDEVAARRALLAPTEKTARIANEAILRRAISHHQLRCLYQPIVELATGTIVGAEALLRWRHPEIRPVMPDEFVGDAEATGVVSLLGRFVLETACRDAARWPRGARGPVPISVNVSPCQLTTGGLVDDVLGALHRSGLPPSRLVLELTEGAQVANLTSAADQLGALRATGIAVALDDLGSGYSSLLRLVRLPVDAVKIDGAFVEAIGEDAHAAAVVRSIVALAGVLGMDAVAEHVETPAQRDRLVDLGCSFGQGFLFGRPMSAGSLEARLTRRHSLLRR